MPKLTRLHLAGIGHKDAKFHPLSLRFTDARNQPAHTLLWLPNGGGKSLLIAFKYAALRPHKRDFLGLRTGRNADLEDFIAPGKMGVVLLEFDFGETSGDRRVIGYTAVRREQGLERTYFSFRSHPALAWESLPVLGLGPEAPNATRLLAALRQGAEKDKARIALFETASQADWEAHLRDDLKLDPEIFGHHLVMNSDEGGVTKLFAKKSTDEFIQLFLQLALEHESIYTTNDVGDRIDKVRQLVADYKRAHHENPRREVTSNLCDELIPLLKQIQANRLQRDELGAILAKQEAAAALLLRSIEEKRTALAREISRLDQEISAKSEEEKAEKARRNLSRAWSEGYDLLYRALSFEEASRVLEDAGVAKERADFRVRLLVAAQAAAEFAAAAAALLTLEEEQRAKLKKLEPDLVALRRLGGHLSWILHDRAAVLAADEETYRTGLQAASLRRSNAKSLHDQINGQMADARRQLTSVQKLQGDLRQRRQQLRAQGFLDEGETAPSGAERWRTQVADLDTRHSGAVHQVELRTDELTDATEELKRAETEVSRVTNEKRRVDDSLSEARTALAALQQFPAIKDVSGGREVSPWNESLGPALEGKQRRARETSLRLRIEGAEDERIRSHYQPPDRPIFPEPRDLEVVRLLLRQHRIEAVSTGYQHLDGAHAQTSEAEGHLRAHPAEWSGLVLASEDDFRRARQLVTKAAISRPVVLISAAWISSAKSKSAAAPVHTVLPQDRGLWNRALARADFHVVEERHTQTLADGSQAEKEEIEASTARAELQRFVQRLPKVKFDGWVEQVAQLELQLTQAGSLRAARASTAVAAKDALQEARRTQLVLSQELTDARRRAERLRDHVKEYESRSEEWNAEETRQNERIALLTDEAPRAERELESATEALAAFPSRQASLIQRQVELLADRARLIERFVGAAVPPAPGETAAILWPKFESAVRLYQQQSDDELLNHRLDVATRRRDTARSEFKKATANLTGEPWKEFASRDDLPALLDKARGDLTSATVENTRAETVYALADSQWPHRLRSSRGKEQIDPERPAENSIAAESLRDQCAREADAADESRERIEREINVRKEERTLLKQAEPKYEAMAERAPSGVAVADAGGHPDFVGRLAEDNELATKIFRGITVQRGILSDAEATAKKLFEEQWMRTLQRDAYTRNPLELRERLIQLGRAEIEADPAKHLKSITGIKEACEDQIGHLAVQRSSLVQHLSARAALAAKRLKALQTESYLPKELDNWGGQPFLKVELSLRNDEAERAQKLSELVEKWAREGHEDDLPAGHVLAFACLKAILASNGATLKILKPNQRLELFWHEITELSGFSEGQRVTAAILIYSILVRLRQKQAGTLEGLPLDAGYLLLDNPLGKANHTALVDLQLRVARTMGLQLIYASGINDPGALIHFGHILRLKNTALDPRTGDKLVQADHRPGKVSVVELGVYPKPQVPPPPAPPRAP